jgi:hypothetical protein
MTQTFVISPADLRWLWFVAVIPLAAVLLAVSALGLAIGGARGARFEVSPEGLRLRNGEKALLYLTDRSRAVYVPTHDGYSVLLSPADPDAFLAALASMRR